MPAKAQPYAPEWISCPGWSKRDDSRSGRRDKVDLQAGVERLRGQVDLVGGVLAEPLDAGSQVRESTARSSRVIVQPSAISSRITIIMSNVVWKMTVFVNNVE